VYDSTQDTLEHIKRVDELLRIVAHDFRLRGVMHDQTKLSSPEKEAFDEFTPKLKTSTYGSDEYKQFLAQLKPALDHHYAHNRHHPEHFKHGINDMTLMDIIEMLLDWKAASERHSDGDIWKSIDINVKRFNIDPQLASILRNTARSMGW
jgi:hypothetical protein